MESLTSRLMTFGSCVGIDVGGIVIERVKNIKNRESLDPLKALDSLDEKINEKFKFWK